MIYANKRKRWKMTDSQCLLLILKLGRHRRELLIYDQYDPISNLYLLFDYVIMLQNSQVLNSKLQKQAKNSSSFGFPPANSKSFDKLQSTETSLGDISQDLIKELTLKNKLLSAQLVQYRTLVNNLKQRLQQADQQNHRLQQLVASRCEETHKLHTIQEQLNILSEITTQSRRRDPEEAEQQYYFHKVSQLLDFYELSNEHLNWDSCISTIQAVLQERRILTNFAQRVQEMKDSIEPGQFNISCLWEWLRKIGANYYYLLNFSKNSRNNKSIQT